MGADGVLDTEQALLRRLRASEINPAGCDAGGQSARIRHGRDRPERR